MTPHAFITKWQPVELKERSAAQSHFNDLCALLGLADPAADDPKGEWFAFEKGASKTGGGEGWADVWRKGCFAWEYKGPGKDLAKAHGQLLQYASALENPPLLIVSDIRRIRIHTNFTNTVAQAHEIALDDLADAAQRDLLRRAFTDPESFKPSKTRAMLTEEAARAFATLAQRLRERGHESQAVAHFVHRLVFCMFAEDVGLLPNAMFTRLLEGALGGNPPFADLARTLFGAMRGGGMVGFERVAWFNGGLFDDDAALPLDIPDVKLLLAAARLDWSAIDPSILGTLFERGLDPDKRSQLGAHYTDAAKIMMIVNPVIVEPLLAEWAATRQRIEATVGPARATVQNTIEQASAHKELEDEVRALRSVLTDKPQLELFADLQKQKRVRVLDEIRASMRAASDALVVARAKAKAIHRAFLDRLAAYRVLDPACGSGNFLNLALLALKDIEHRANIEAEELGLERAFPRVGPECVLGIEVNPYAAELARVSVWIGEIQWMRRHGFDAAKNPILRTLDTIECRDAVLGADGTRAVWPVADAVVGNPPFLGDKKMFSLLGQKYTVQMREVYANSLVGRSDLVCYWFEQCLRQIRRRELQRAGLVSTNSIRQKSNRGILDKINRYAPIFQAWSDEPWVIDGAAVRVSIICYGTSPEPRLLKLDGLSVTTISSGLTSIAEVGDVLALLQNKGYAFQGIKRVGQFEIKRSIAIEWLLAPVNPNGRKNSDVLRPWASGFDVVRRPQDLWIVDYGWDMPQDKAALYELPFSHVERVVRPERKGKREERANEMWWIFYWPRPEMRKRLKNTSRYLARPSVAKHHIFRWIDSRILPDGALVVICREDDTTFGILQSRFHELWGLSRGSTLEDRPAYTPSTTFETFPFPEGLTPDIAAADYARDPRAQAIAATAARLNELRENWLNPADLVRRVPEVVPGYPDRLIPVDAAATAELKKRTLTNLYNARPAWLANAHAVLDQAVADAYGWGADWLAGTLPDDAILARLFALNQERAGRG